MKMRLYNVQRTYNRATRTSESSEFLAGDVKLSDSITDAMRNAAEQYRLSLAEVAALALAYYFGAGADHLQCERCDFWLGCCRAPEVGEQAAMPLLDKGMAVVGLSTSEQGV